MSRGLIEFLKYILSSSPNNQLVNAPTVLGRFYFVRSSLRFTAKPLIGTTKEKEWPDNSNVLCSWRVNEKGIVPMQ